MANLAGRDPFLALEKMDIGILPGVALSDQEKALDAASIIHAAYEELGPTPSDLDSGIAAALANRSIAGAKVTVGAGWNASVQVGSKTQTGVSMAVASTLANFPIFYVDPGAWRPQLVVPYAGYQATLYYALTSPVGGGLTVNWGDGATETITTGSEKVHTYASTGTYNLRITGAARTLAFSGMAGALKAILAPLQGITGITGLTSFCYTCSGLTSLPADLFRYLPTVEQFGNVFFMCSGLTSLPEDLFRYNTAALDFGSAFNGCSSLTTVSADLFKYNTQVTNFSDTFLNCANLTTPPLMPWHA